MFNSTPKYSQKDLENLTAGYHEFGFDGTTLRGPIRSVELIEGRLEIQYDYVIDGVSFVGSYSATEEPDGSFKGAWTENSNQRVNNVDRWNGSAHVVMSESDDRRTFRGTWTEGNVSEPWFIETPK